MIDLPENELVIRAQSGDGDAEEVLLRRFEGPTHRRAAFLSAGHEDRLPDIRQAIRLGTWRAIQKFDGVSSSLSTYVAWWADGYARRALAESSVVSISQYGFEDTADSPEVQHEREELASRVREAVAACEELDELDRCVFECRVLVRRRNLNDIAAQFGVAHSTVRLRETRLLRHVLPRVLAPLRDLLR